MGISPGGPYLLYSDTMGAGDLLPTSPQLLRTAVSAEDANWTGLYAAMIAALAAGKVNAAYTSNFTDKRAAWQIFASSLLSDTPISIGEAASQLDGWKAERAAWAKDLETRSGVQLPILHDAPPPPPESAPGSLGDVLSKSTGLLVAGAVLAAILVFGPHFHE
jgi:hypothetical protein